MFKDKKNPFRSLMFYAGSTFEKFENNDVESLLCKVSLVKMMRENVHELLVDIP